MNIFKRIYLAYFDYVNRYDPVVNCEFYREKGCTHVDGFLCNMKTCGILSEYRSLNKYE